MPTIRNYFAAANTHGGFRSLFDHIFSPDRLKRLYIIKGGSGTGKSRMMNDIAAQATKLGYDIELFYCSSDIDSLDGLLIPALNTAVVDGTAPHVTEAKYPGAVEIIIDLVQFMNLDYLASNKAAIMDKIKAKTQMFATAYKYLSATEDINEAVRDILRSAYLRDKARGSMDRLMNEYAIKPHSQNQPQTDIRYISSLSSKGSVTLDTLFKLGAKIITISNSYNLGYRYLTELSDIAGEMNLPRLICPTPLNPDLTEGLYLPESNLALTVVKEELTKVSPAKHINIERFIEKGTINANRHKLRFADRCVDSMLSGAYESFSDAFKVHQSLEEIYIKSMDFTAKEALTKRIAERIFQ